METLTFDLREQDRAGFRRWLGAQLARWARDPVFSRRGEIRELRRAHPGLLRLEHRLREAEAADRATPTAARLAEIDSELLGVRKAVAGLSAALPSAAAPDRERLVEKLARFGVKQAALAEEHEEYTCRSPERQVLLALRAELAALRTATGLATAEAEVATLQRESGRGSGRAGEDFEAVAVSLTSVHLLPELAARAGVPVERLEVLRGVTLGAVDTEIDQLVVRVAAEGVGPVEALALVEVKGNPNDLAHGFLRRRANLAWLRGESRLYDAEAQRNRHFPTGHFDRPAEHRQGGASYRLTPDSFRGLDPGESGGTVPPGLYLVTREGTLWGLSSASLARIAHRVSRDEQWDPEDASYLELLLRECRSLAEPMEAPDVLRLYDDAGAADRVLFVGR